MGNGVCIKDNFILPEFDRKEILRYAGGKGETGAELSALLEECLTECKSDFSPRVCFRVLEREAFFHLFDKEQKSRLLQTRLQGCDRVLIFAATVGIGIDRRILKYASISPAKALLFQAVGAERIESLCEVFCQEVSQSYGETTARFSAGYGDFPLTTQSRFFELLDCARAIGLTLTDSLLMTPTKSVTAVIGLGKNTKENGCSACTKEDCEFRK